MQVELSTLEQNKTWSFTTFPPSKHPVGCKWVYNLKFQADGSLEQHKTQFFAKGYTQQEGVDYFDTFSPMAKLVIVKILLVLATINGWFLVQLDANNVFLHNDLAKEVYMCLPLRYHHEK